MEEQCIQMAVTLFERDASKHPVSVENDDRISSIFTVPLADLLSYVTHSGEGEGLLFYGNVILPFVDRFPTDLELYRIMTTKLTEVQEAKEV